MEKIHAKKLMRTMHMKVFRKWSLWGIFALGLLTVSLSQTGCSGKKKAEQAAADERARQIARAKQMLREILADTSSSLEEKEATLDQVRAMQLSDPEVIALIAEVEAALLKERQLLEKQQEEEAKAAAENERRTQLKQDLESRFKSIAMASGVEDANRQIEDALQVFASAQVPVLTIIAMNSEGLKDYDRPSTIRKFLDYIKDQKQVPAQIHHIRFNEAGKISELELIK